jgi:HlyD family secretion protein
MAHKKKVALGFLGIIAAVLLTGVVLRLMPVRQTSRAEVLETNGPLMSRGNVDSPAGTVVIAGDLGGGGVLDELRITDGQKVKKDDIVAVLSNYSRADVTVRTSKAELTKAKRQLEAMNSGYRVSEIAVQQAVVKTTSLNTRLKTLEVARSGKTPEIKDLELRIAQQDLEREQTKLRMMTETLSTDRDQTESDVKILEAKLDQALTVREQSLVRTPIDGVVVQIYSRQGERVSPNGIAKIVDLGQLRVLAYIDEVYIGRIAKGRKVRVAFRGYSSVYTGRIVRVAPAINRIRLPEADSGSSSDGRVVQVEIELDDPSKMPQVIGREARVTFF